MIRYLSVLILVVVFSSACRYDKCTQSFSEQLNLSVLPLWEKKTQINMASQNDNKLVSRLNLEREYKQSIFDRKDFLNDLFKKNQLDGYKFESLTIVEFTSNSEKYKQVKYLLASCDLETRVIKYALNQGKWELTKVRIVNAEKIDRAIKLLSDRSGDIFYESHGIDLLAVTKFRGHHKITVEVFGSISKKQNEALKIMEK